MSDRESRLDRLAAATVLAAGLTVTISAAQLRGEEWVRPVGIVGGFVAAVVGLFAVLPRPPSVSDVRLSWWRRFGRVDAPRPGTPGYYAATGRDYVDDERTVLGDEYTLMTPATYVRTIRDPRRRGSFAHLITVHHQDGLGDMAQEVHHIGHRSVNHEAAFQPALHRGVYQRVEIAGDTPADARILIKRDDWNVISVTDRCFRERYEARGFAIVGVDETVPTGPVEA